MIEAKKYFNGLRKEVSYYVSMLHPYRLLIILCYILTILVILLSKLDPLLSTCLILLINYVTVEGHRFVGENDENY